MADTQLPSLWQFLNFAAYIFMIVLNVVASVVGFGGETNSTISGKNPTTFTPAGYAFSIWGLIFLFLGFLAIFQMFPSNKVEGGIVAKLGPFFVINMICNGLWSVIFAYQIFWLSTIVILCILGTLIYLYMNLGIGTEDTPAPADMHWALRFWCVEFPLSLYLGWISVASIIQLAVLFITWGWISGQDAGSVVMQCVAILLGLAMAIRNRDVAFNGVLCWALLAIGSKQTGSVSTCAYVLGIFAGVVALATFVWRMVTWNQAFRPVEPRDSESRSRKVEKTAAET